MPKLDETETPAAEKTTKCSSDKENAAATAAAASAATLPQKRTAQPPHTSPPSSSSASTAPKENMQRGLSTKVALSRLHEEIEQVLLLEEKEQRAEG